jgi:hypothetical protein
VIWVKSEPKYFCKGGWTGVATQPVGQNHPTDRSTRPGREAASAAVR